MYQSIDCIILPRAIIVSGVVNVGVKWDVKRGRIVERVLWLGVGCQVGGQLKAAPDATRSSAALRSELPGASIIRPTFVLASMTNSQAAAWFHGFLAKS